MDDKLPHLGERKENERDVNYSRGRRRERARNYRQREHQGGPSSTDCTASGNDTRGQYRTDFETNIFLILCIG